MNSIRKVLFVILNTLAQVFIWAGFKLLQLSARIYGRDIDVKYIETKIGAMIRINRKVLN